ncbi:myosin phosphatase Rho-interacting protein isoform X10 [Acanthochromis polyacanthus]|uniref:myosin phosphatase Rho-interacting protein isoform X10 n=1 Tax=Acanthochromis polyacanthus TaxID=80966 RepID=UPI0022341B3C|nr:myosin phosphatase Rho-interacting protein isoform X10 [Acanthochromis polyacanthus]
MSFKDNACRKFQANIFNKSKCQNCFKPRESHLLNDEDLNQAKPIYGGWLLLAPEGTNFDNPLHRSRKWQRRFFILYEHGLLRYALDEMPSTLPQGTINMNQCSDVIDGESRTGQKNSLCILTPEKEHFIRAECKEIINGWQEALTVYPRTNKQNQKKKRKVDPPTQQEPGPAKVTVTSSSTGGSIPCLPSSIASAERVPMSRSSLWQEESRWSRATIPCSRSASCISQLSQSQPDSSNTTQDDASTVSTGRKVRVESGYFSLEKTKSEPAPQSAHHPQPPQHLPLSTSTSSSSFGAPSSRYNSESEPQTSPHQPLQDPLPSPGALVSPSYSTISSSQSSLDSDPSGAAPAWEGHGGGGGGSGSIGGGGGGRIGRSGREYAALSDVPRARRLTYREAFRSEKKRQDLRARTRSPGREEVARLFGEERRRTQIIGRFEEGQHVERMDTSSSNEPSVNTVLTQRQGRSERRYLTSKHEMSLDSAKDRSAPDVSSSSFANLRRAKSLDRRVTESSMTPDLLNFKKGWMTKLYDDGMWKKHWFVLTDQSLRYYKDSIAEEASEMDGEIDLSTCYDVKEFPVQRNYGFQILCKEGVCTLSAMTSGIRRNWIQAIMKNVRPTIAPDVTRSIPDEKIKSHVMLEPCLQPAPEPNAGPEVNKSDVHRQPGSAPASEPRKSRVRERRREGRSKTYDWSEFKMEQTEKPVKERAGTIDLSSSFSTTSSYCSPSSSPSSLASSPVSTSSIQTSSVSGAHPPSATEEAEKENVRRGVPPHSATSATHMPNTVTVTVISTLNATPSVQPSTPESPEQGKMEVDHPAAMSSEREDKKGNRSPDVQVEIEQRWHQVETTPLREEKQVPITTALGNSSNSDRLPAHELAALLDKELGQKQKELDRLQKQNNLLKEQLEDALGREQSAREGYVLQATCERGFAAMEETHQKVIEDLQRQHQREISKLMEERERLLAEETAATIAAIEAMKNAHKEELEKTQRSQLSGLNSDIDELRLQYEEELQSIQRELEVLSEQYSQKCLENAHLAQALEAERQALRQCQRENQELNAHNQELNNRLTAEITRMRSCFSGETALSPLTKGKDVYELEVLLRIKESEIQYLKQEIHSLKDELQSALRDKKYATDKYKDIYTELSIVKAKADCDISKLKEKLLIATEALGERTVDGTVTSGYDIMKSKSNPDFMKKEQSSSSKQSRGLRSKSLKEGLTVQERMKLFEAKDSRKI